MTNPIVWGGTSPSSIEAVAEGECINLTYQNGMSFYPGTEMSVELLGQTARIEFGAGEIVDTFIVEPGPGWQVVTENFLLVPEWTDAIITVCQILLG